MRVGIILSCALASFIASLCEAQIKVKDVECKKNVGFYRKGLEDGEKATGKYCSVFYECSDLGVFKYTCGPSQRFNIETGHCDYRRNVKPENCGTAVKGGIPLLEAADCAENLLGCADGTCINNELFCNGEDDCPDGSDETYCTIDKDPNAAPHCDPDSCQLPDCFCSSGGGSIPGNLNPEETPQMIMISFDDAVNMNNLPIYEEIFGKGLTNPNGCKIPATYYLSHQWTDYRLVQSLYKDGHEIALHSTTHKAPESWWSDASIKDLEDEFITNKKILMEFGLLPESALQGLRVPWLSLGGNKQFKMMQNNKILFDHTITAPYPQNFKYWPYTLDYRMPHSCFSAKKDSCPTRSFPGVWVLPMNVLHGAAKDKGEFHCPMLDMCPPLSYKEMLEFLKSNFQEHYTTNRAPFGMYFHSRWFIEDGHYAALVDFLNYTLTLPDVYYATPSQVLDWVRDPRPVGQDQPAFSCDEPRDVPEACSAEAAYCGNLPASYPGAPAGSMFTCRTDPKRCPVVYPWLNAYDGEPQSLQIKIQT